MKISKIKNIRGFLKVLDECKGEVGVITSEGDRLNLKSKLSQLISIERIFSKADILHLEIVSDIPSDLEKINDFFLNENN